MKCNEEQVRLYQRIASAIGEKDRRDNLIADLAADWLDLVVEIEHYKDRERHFAKALQVADGGDYRADWDGAISRVIAERDSLRKRLADAETVNRRYEEKLREYKDRIRDMSAKEGK